MKNLTLLAAAALAACGGSGGGESTPPINQPPVNQSLSGLWEGVDSDGDEVFGLVTDSGDFHLFDQFGQGVGTAVVSDGDQVSATYAYAVDFGTTFPDGSTSEACSATGTVVEGQTLMVDIDCLTDQGSAVQVSATLTYNPLFDRSASLATIAGMYDDAGNVLTIDSTGALFEQDATTGCTLNGQVAVIEPSHNVYAVEFAIDTCAPDPDGFNGTTWTGVAALDDTVAPEVLVIGVLGDVAVSGVPTTFALARETPRM
jgi:hypothetical protein